MLAHHQVESYVVDRFQREKRAFQRVEAVFSVSIVEAHADNVHSFTPMQSRTSYTTLVKLDASNDLIEVYDRSSLLVL